LAGKGAGLSAQDARGALGQFFGAQFPSSGSGQRI